MSPDCGAGSFADSDARVAAVAQVRARIREGMDTYHEHGYYSVYLASKSKHKVDARGVEWVETRVGVQLRNVDEVPPATYRVRLPASQQYGLAALVVPISERHSQEEHRRAVNAFVRTIPGVTMVEFGRRHTPEDVDVSVRPRVMGIEQEYEFSVRTRRGFDEPAVGSRTEVNSNVRRSLLSAGDFFDETKFPNLIPELSPNGSDYLLNGARLYLDGAHPEYATPECTSVADVVAHDVAGSEILHRIMSVLTDEASGDDARSVVVDCMKRNVADYGPARGQSWGTHENYLVRDDLSFAQLSVELTPFLATRPLLVGAGGVVSRHPGGKLAVVRSPRGLGSKGVFSSGGSDRPFIMTRDEPHAGSGWRRLQVPVADGNRTQFSNWMKIGTTHLTLRLVEEMPGAVARWSLRDPVRGLHAVSGGVGGRDPKREGPMVDLADGRRVRALDVQEAYAERALELVNDRPSTDEERALATQWRQLVDDLRSAAPGVERRVEWMLKAAMIYRLMDRDHVKLRHPMVRELVDSFASIDPDVSPVRRLEASGYLPTVVDADAIADASVNPPATRAAARVALMREVYGAGLLAVTRWDAIAVTNAADSDIPVSFRTVNLPDPFDANPDESERIADIMAMVGVDEDWAASTHE